MVLRRATPADGDAIATIWHRGWRDGHLGHVAESLILVRTEHSFQTRTPKRLGDTTVAEVDGAVAGFVMVSGAEVEQLYVDGAHRGSGVAGALLAEGERQTRAAGYDSAWLAVVAGNQRARRFYEKHGWRDHGDFRYRAHGPERAIEILARRYAKRL